MLELCNLLSDFEFTGSNNENTVLSFKRDFELLNCVETKKLWGILKLDKMYFCIIVWPPVYGGQRVEYGGLNENDPIGHLVELLGKD